MPKPAIDAKVEQRFAELVGLGCTQHEAARAVGIGERTGERLMAKPGFRALIEKSRRDRSGMAADFGAVESAPDEDALPEGVRRVYTMPKS